VTEIARWLEEIGLHQYADLFERLDVDFERLTNLSEQDLEQLGLPLAARRVLLREIALLAAPVGSSPAPASPISPEKAERRQLTIMFCDLVNSVGLSSQLDPEDLREVIAAYQQACAQSIRRYSGYIANYVGDGLLILFGYPVAHEDDAERAVHAGLEIVDAVSELTKSEERFADLDLRVRVGIATGLVVVGDVVAEGISDRDAVAGEAANLAARLQGVADPNSVVVSALTRRLAAERFEYRYLGVRDLKGFTQPVPIYQIIGEREVTRLEARSAALSQFIDRDKEIEILLECWQRAVSGNGQVVIISGEAGIGKSRIAAELAACIRRTGRGRSGEISSPLIFQCSPFHSNASLHPIIRQLERLAEIGRLDAQREKFDKLNDLLGQHYPERYQTISLVGDLLGLEPDERYPPLTVSPAVKRHLTIEALRDWCAFRGKDHPLLIVFEDVQWIDPTSKLFLNRLVNWAKNARVLITITVRTDSGTSAAKFLEEAGLVTAYGRRSSHITICEIRELSDVEAKQLVAAVAEGRGISQMQFDAVVTKSEGIPLYIEELVKAVVSSIDSLPTQDEGDQTGTVPNTITDALMAQLDQLGQAKEVAQHASAIGQEFSPGLLAKIATKSLDELAPELNRLIDSKIVVQSATTSNVYRFRHALIRDISYRSLLRRNRRQIHLRIASELAQPAAEAGGATNDLIAQHYSLGESHLEAIRYWQKGAKDAIARSAHEEALGMLHAALADLRKMRGSRPVVLELDLVLAQATALRSLRGYSAPEVEEGLVKARELCVACADTSNRFNIEWGLFQCTLVKGDIAGARQLAVGLFEHAERHPDRPLVDAHLANGMAAFHCGDFEGATNFFEKGVSLSRPETDQPHFFTHGQNPGLFCLSYLARTQCFLGYLDRGRATINRGLAIAATRARDPGHIYGYVNALIHAARVYHMCGDIAAEKRVANETISISRRNHYAYYEAMSTCHLGWVAGAEGSLSDGITKMVDGIAALEKTATELGLPGFYIRLAELYIRAGQLDEASRALQKAVGPPGFGTRAWDAEIERVRGDMFALRAHPDFKAAENAYLLSLFIARYQKAGLLIFKTGSSLARLLQRLDRRREGYEVLKGCLEQLPEGFDTQDVRNAQTTMNDLNVEQELP
jgi:class 3 adenylate cyclase/predicted negative regulator of RcsB-dependent stress response